MTQLCLSRRAEWNAHQRAANVAIWLYNGSRFRTVDVARLLGMSYMGAHYLMMALSGGLPIRQEGGVWRWIEEDSKGPAE